MTTDFHEVKNNAYSSLASGINDLVLTFTVAAGEGARFPTTNHWVLIDSELIEVDSRAGDVFTVVAGTGRASQSTVAASHLAGAGVYLYVTAGEITELQTAVNAIETLNPRERLSANHTYYVRTDGNDSNTGLVNNAGGAFLTIQKAIDAAAALDTSIYDVTIQVGNGTYTITSALTAKAITGAGLITIIGDETTPTNVIIDGNAFTSIFNSVAIPTTYKLKGFQLKSSTANVTLGILSSNNSYVEFQNLNFGTGLTQQIRAADGGMIKCTGIYTISGGGSNHITCVGGFIRVQGTTITVTGTPAFSEAFINMGYLSVGILNSITFSGSATGVRYLVTMNSAIYTGGGGANYFPGDSAGSAATGGQYS